MWCSGNWENLTLALSGVLEGRMAWMFHKSSQATCFITKASSQKFSRAKTSGSGALSAFFSRVCSPPRTPKKRWRRKRGRCGRDWNLVVSPVSHCLPISVSFHEILRVQEILSYNWKLLVPFLLAFFQFSSHHFNPWTVAVQPLNGGVACVEWWLQVEFNTYLSTSHHQKKGSVGKKKFRLIQIYKSFCKGDGRVSQISQACFLVGVIRTSQAPNVWKFPTEPHGVYGRVDLNFWLVGAHFPGRA